MKTVNKDVFNYINTRLLDFRDFYIIPGNSIFFELPEYSEQLTVTEEAVDKLSGEIYSFNRNVSDIHYLLQENSLTPDSLTMKRITESLSKTRPSGVESFDEDFAFDGVVNRYIQRKPELDEFDKETDLVNKSYKEYLDYQHYLSSKDKDKDKDKENNQKID